MRNSLAASETVNNSDASSRKRRLLLFRTSFICLTPRERLELRHRPQITESAHFRWRADAQPVRR